jgi:nucleoside-diphosphate-sugar epimerase
MKILIIGGVSQTARHVTRSLLANGHEVTALAGPAAYAPVLDSRLRIAGGDPRNARCIEGAVENQDLVISCLGTLSRIGIHDVVMQNLELAMTKFGVKRLVKLLN